MSEKFDPQKKYIQMRSMELAADKVLRYLDEIQSSNPHMYSKTKNRYFELACRLLDCVGKIGKLIDEEQLSSIASSKLSNPDFSILPEVVQQSTSSQITQVNHTIDYKHTEARFHEVLKQACRTDFKYDEVNQCAKLLYLWFDSRFPSSPLPGFAYKVEWFPDLISNFILTFGKFMHERRLGDFHSEVENWCNKLDANQKYTVPYSVFQLTKSLEPEDYTLEAVLINDLLVDTQLYLLSEYEFSDGCTFYDGNLLAQKVRQMNSTLIPEIRLRINKQKELLHRFNFTPSDIVA